MAPSNKFNREVYKLFINTITEATDLELLAKQLTQIIVGTTGIRGMAVLILDPSNDELEFLASAGLSRDYLQKGPILANKSIRLGSNREPVIISNVETSDQLQYPEKARQEGIKAIISQPVKRQGKLIGALRFYHSEEWDVSDNDMDYIELLAQNVAMALIYFRVRHAVHNVQETVNEIHPVWL